MKIKTFFFVFLLLGLFFSDSGWEMTLDSSISTTPDFLANNLIVGTYAGSIYSLSLTSGSQTWKENLGGPIAQINIFENKIFAFLENGTIYSLRDDGKILNTFGLNSYIFGTEATEDNIYISSENGIAVFDGAKISPLYDVNGTYTAPTYYLGKILVGKDSRLLYINPDGTLIFEKELGPFWKSKPIVYTGIAYIGSMDHFMYAIDLSTENQIWMYGTNGAITSQAIASGGNIYFGGNDGYLYSVESSSGKLNWKSKTNGAIFFAPVLGQIGKQSVVFVGSFDSYLYGFDRITGELLWGYPAIKQIDHIVLNENQLFVVSGEYLLSISSTRSCVFTEPTDRTKAGYKEVEIKGKVFSEYENAVAQIRVNSGPWEQATSANNSFSYALNPNQYPFGLLQIECRVIDSLGQSITPTKLYMIRSADFAKPEFNLEYTPTVKEGNQIFVNVYDKETGEPLKDFEYTIKGKTYNGSDFIIYNASIEETVPITFNKIGYNSKRIEVVVEKDWTLPIIGAIILVFAVIIFWLKFLRKRPAE